MVVPRCTASSLDQPLPLLICKANQTAKSQHRNSVSVGRAHVRHGDYPSVSVRCQQGQGPEKLRLRRFQTAIFRIVPVRALTDSTLLGNPAVGDDCIMPGLPPMDFAPRILRLAGFHRPLPPQGFGQHVTSVCPRLKLFSVYTPAERIVCGVPVL